MRGFNEGKWRDLRARQIGESLSHVDHARLATQEADLCPHRRRRRCEATVAATHKATTTWQESLHSVSKKCLHVYLSVFLIEDESVSFLPTSPTATLTLIISEATAILTAISHDNALVEISSATVWYQLSSFTVFRVERCNSQGKSTNRKADDRHGS